MPDIQRLIDVLGLVEHPEGGYFRETYRAAETIKSAHLPERFGGDRAFSTAIFYLLAGADFSALHRIKQDEVWHFYEGSALLVHVITPGGEYKPVRLGMRLEDGETPQAVVAAGCFFGASVSDRRSYALVGCTVAPGFDFEDFEMPPRDQLIARFPQHKNIIEKLTR